MIEFYNLPLTLVATAYFITSALLLRNLVEEKYLQIKTQTKFSTEDCISTHLKLYIWLHATIHHFKTFRKPWNAVGAPSFKNGDTQDEGRIPFNLTLHVNIHQITSRYSQPTGIFILIQILKAF